MPRKTYAFQILLQHNEDWGKLGKIKFPKTLGGMFRRACWEIPHIVGSSMMALLGIGMAVIGVKNYYENDGDNREYKQVYTIIRPTDPRAKCAKNPTCTP